jgi:Gpi18-like mannosyltransferase
MVKDRYGLIAAIVISAIALHASFWPFVSHDLVAWLTPWMNVLIMKGPVGAFSAPFSNYTPPYLYLLSIASMFSNMFAVITLIKTVSVVTAIALAASIYRLLLSLGVQRPLEAAAWSLVLPSVVFNVSLLAQCDPLWVAPCIMATAAANRGRNIEMLIWTGIAFAIKAQAAFFAPFVFLILLRSRAPFYLWLIPPGIYVLAMTPAWLAGWPALDLATVYLRQAQWNPSFMGNAANPWSFVNFFYPTGGWAFAWIGYVAALGSVAIYTRVLLSREFTPRLMLAAATLSATLVPFLLPKMHERYFLLADILAFVLAMVGRDKRTLEIALLINGASALAILGYLNANTWALIGGVLVAAAISKLVVELTPGHQIAEIAEA